MILEIKVKLHFNMNQREGNTKIMAPHSAPFIICPIHLYSIFFVSNNSYKNNYGRTWDEDFATKKLAYPFFYDSLHSFYKNKLHKNTKTIGLVFRTIKKVKNISSLGQKYNILIKQCILHQTADFLYFFFYFLFMFPL